MSNENLAKVKITLPKDSANFFYGAKIEVDGKSLVLYHFEIKPSYIEGDQMPCLVLHIAPECFEIVAPEDSSSVSLITKDAKITTKL